MEWFGSVWVLLFLSLSLFLALFKLGMPGRNHFFIIYVQLYNGHCQKKYARQTQTVKTWNSQVKQAETLRPTAIYSLYLYPTLFFSAGQLHFCHDSRFGSALSHHRTILEFETVSGISSAKHHQRVQVGIALRCVGRAHQFLQRRKLEILVPNNTSRATAVSLFKREQNMLWWNFHCHVRLPVYSRKAQTWSTLYIFDRKENI